jgi:hypothetical protein
VGWRAAKGGDVVNEELMIRNMLGHRMSRRGLAGAAGASLAGMAWSVPASVPQAAGMRVSLRDFEVAGRVGTGNADADTAALLAAIDYAHAGNANDNYRHQIELPAGDYRFRRIRLQSLRGVTFRGEGTADATKRKTRWAYAGPGGEDAALVIRSCAWVRFQGIHFDLGAGEGMTNLVQFQANHAATKSPLNRFSNNWITFADCVLYVPQSISRKPAATVWAKSCSSVFFDRCSIYAGAINAVKFGSDNDNDPDTGGQTFGNGLSVVAAIRDSYVSGDIQREKSYSLMIRGTQFAVRPDAPTQVSRLTTSGRKVAMNEVIEGNIWDRTGVKDFAGILIEGGDSEHASGNLRIVANQLDGRLTLIKVNRGDAYISGNRPIAYGGASSNVFVQIGQEAGNVKVECNEAAEYIEANQPGRIVARLVIDERAAKFGPVIAAAVLDAPVRLAAGGSFVSVFSQSHAFPGGRVRIAYSVSVQHAEANALRTYVARMHLDGKPMYGTARQVGLKEGGQMATIACEAIIYVGATDGAKTIALALAQLDGGRPGSVMAIEAMAETSWLVELLDS